MHPSSTIWVIEYWDSTEKCYVPSVDVARTLPEIKTHQRDGRWGEIPTRVRQYARLVTPNAVEGKVEEEATIPPAPSLPPIPEVEIEWGPELQIHRSMQSFADAESFTPDVDIPLDAPSMSAAAEVELLEPKTLPPLDFTKTIPMETIKPKPIELDMAKTMPLKTISLDFSLDEDK